MYISSLERKTKCSHFQDQHGLSRYFWNYFLLEVAYHFLRRMIAFCNTVLGMEATTIDNHSFPYVSLSA